MARLQTSLLFPYPFLPLAKCSFTCYTMKLLSTSKRYHRLEKDLDVNAGRLLEGVSLEQLTLETFAQVVKVAEGTRSFGERAGHSQVSDFLNSNSRSKFGETGTVNLKRMLHSTRILHVLQEFHCKCNPFLFVPLPMMLFGLKER